MNSIYTEYANLTDEHKAWLDGCGITWASSHKFSLFESRYVSILKLDGTWRFMLKSSEDKLVTGDEFCQRVAEILGIDKPTFGATKEMFDVPFYHHKTYRILDSLDGVPFDTRIPLSEWIPPYKMEVVFIRDNWYEKGFISGIQFDRYVVQMQDNKEVYLEYGHWMRIV